LLASSAFATLLGAPAQAQAQAQEPAQAQGAAAPAAPAAAASASSAKTDVVGLDRVVVTATSANKSKMRSSVSVTDVDNEQVTNFGARSEAEVLHLIPGIRAESSAGPGGNSNITVRGLPISSGGSKFVQLQEDGLPVVEFGDMNFGNNDYFIRFDNNVDHIETLRGGSAATLASHAPGAVINYISKTGKEQGGSIGLTRGLNYRETRVDGDYGGKIASDLRFHIGGYFRDGEGPRIADTAALHGYQLKGNITKTFNGDKGYFRVSFKALNENAPTYTSMPALATVSGNTVTGMSSLPNFDIKKESQLSIYNQTMPTADLFSGASGVANISNGITVKSNALGMEFKNELDGGWNVQDRFKMSKTSSSFQTQFWGAETLGSLLTNLGGASAKYFNGPLTGQTVTTANLQTGLVSQSAAINQQSPDMGHWANDLSLSKTFDLGTSKLNGKAGLYMSNQDIVQKWQISERVMEIGHNGAIIDVYDAAGAALTTAGLTGYNNQWGGCCARDIDAHYATTAPYLALGLEAGQWDLDASLRHDTMRARGSYAGGKAVAGGFDVNRDGQITGAEKNVVLVDSANPSPINYRVGYTSYSLGANYRFNNDLSAFVRISKGGRAIADRLLFSPFVDPITGRLTTGLEAQAVATVKQREIGVKHRGQFMGGSYGLFATLFQATVDEYDYDQTRTVGPKLNVVGTKANGLELESAFSIGNFALNANVVYTDLKVTTDQVGDATGNSTVGKVPGGVPKWLFTITPSYTFGPLTVGASVWGQSFVWNNSFDTAKVAGRSIVNAYASYALSDRATLNLNISNLFDKVASSGGVGGPDLMNGQSIVQLRPETGRSISVSLRYSL
jgi:outer membrane receptor protein involved in Fe transport